MVATGESGQFGVMDQHLLANAASSDLLLLYQVIERSNADRECQGGGLSVVKKARRVWLRRGACLCAHGGQYPPALSDPLYGLKQKRPPLMVGEVGGDGVRKSLIYAWVQVQPGICSIRAICHAGSFPAE